jgi:riboflavin kinase/FMN adenylyltransferase
MQGRQLGRTIGFPTANLQVGNSEKLIPADGVYAVEVEIIDPGPPFPEAGAPAGVPLASGDPTNGARIKGMMNIGMRPTVDGRERTIEVHLFDFNGDLYGRELRVSVISYLRGEEKFPGLDALKAQLALDKENSLAALQARGR